jgi:hypothetical protein
MYRIITVNRNSTITETEIYFTIITSHHTQVHISQDHLLLLEICTDHLGSKKKYQDNLMHKYRVYK